MKLLDDAKRAFGVTEDQELAAKIGCSKSTISKWRAKGEIPGKAERDLKKLLSGMGFGIEPEGDQESGIKKVELSQEDQENLDLILRLNSRKKRELRAELYRLLAEQERESLKGADH